MSETAEPVSPPPPQRYYIYGKHFTQQRFRPMNLREGTRVVNLVHASRLSGRGSPAIHGSRGAAQPGLDIQATPDSSIPAQPMRPRGINGAPPRWVPPQNFSPLAEHVGHAVARRIFMRRGNKSEVHLSEAPLAATAAGAADLMKHALSSARP